MNDKLPARFGRHHDPIQDFIAEVADLEAQAGPGRMPADSDLYRARVAAALDFLVGADLAAIGAKDALRKLQQRLGDALPGSEAPPPAPCDCIETINRDLREKHNAHMVTTLFGRPSRCVIQTEKLDPKKRGRTPAMLASFCPFCGQKHQSEGAASPVAETGNTTPPNPPGPIQERLKAGQQFNAYDLVDGGYVIGIGPITDILSLAETRSAIAANWLISVLRAAHCQPQAAAPVDEVAA